MDDNVKPNESVKSSEMVSVPAKEWEAMKGQVKLLTKAASKVRLATHADPEKLGRSFRISLYQDLNDLTKAPLIVMGWRLIKDVAIPNNETERLQTLELTLEDESVVELELADFYKIIKKEEVDMDVEKSQFNPDTSLRLAVFHRNGKTYEIDPIFIN